MIPNYAVFFYLTSFNSTILFNYISHDRFTKVMKPHKGHGMLIVKFTKECIKKK